LLSKKWKTESFRPFDPVSKRITAEVNCDGKKYTCAKGAPNAILKLANLPKDKAQAYKDKSQEFASRGFRSLGVAVQEQGGEWQVLGLLPMFDPPRKDTAQTINEAGELGVHVKMLTGDAVAIAKETCRMLSMGTNVYDSDRLMSGSMGGAQVSTNTTNRGRLVFNNPCVDARFCRECGRFR
jgi:H+-transporting ATPase